MRPSHLVAALAAFVLASAAASAAAPSEREAVDGFVAARAAVGASDGLRLVIAPPDAAADIALRDDTLTIPAKALQLAHSRQELEGLYVLALGLAQAPPPDKARHYSAEEWLAAGAAAVAGSEVNRSRRLNPREYEPQNDPSLNTARPREAPAVSARGRRLLVAMARAGTCSGPALAYLDRLARELPSRAAIVLARSARSDFGPLAYPPEYACAPD